MLDKVFYETPGYRSLLEEQSRRVVVGRRGTGKSAMFYKLQNHWASEPRALTGELSPVETDVIGLRPIVALFGAKPSYLRAACKLAWQYALLQEILSELTQNFNMICNSIRVAFQLDQENSLRTWDKVTARDLQGMEGFRQCLRLTLYRPRDLVSLLNSAFNHARSQTVLESILISRRKVRLVKSFCVVCSSLTPAS